MRNPFRRPRHEHAHPPRETGWPRAKRPRPTTSKRIYQTSRDVGHLGGWGTIPYTSLEGDIYRALPHLRYRTRQEYQNNPYTKAAVSLVKRSVLGPRGIRMRAMPRGRDGMVDREVAKLVEEAWTDWCRKGTPDVTGRLSMKQIEEIALFSLLVDGEFFMMSHTRGEHGIELEVVDAQQVDVRYNKNVEDSPNLKVVMGVELDNFRRPRGYYLTDLPGVDESPRLSTRNKVTRRVSARRMCHCFVREFPQQVRGVPTLSSVLERLQNLREYEEAELQSATIASSKLGFLKKSEFGDSFTPDDTDDEGNPVMDAEPGTITQLPSGVEFTEWNPTHPSGNFVNFQKTQLQGVSAGAGVQYHDISGDLGGVNFSSLRQANITQRDYWRTLHELITTEIHDWVFPRWLRMALVRGTLQVPRRYAASMGFEELLRVQWIPRAWEHVQPREQATAEQMAVALGTRSRSAIIRDRGDDPVEVFEDIAQENALFEELGILGFGQMPEPEMPEEEEPEEDDPEEEIDEEDGPGDGEEEDENEDEDDDSGMAQTG